MVHGDPNFKGITMKQFECSPLLSKIELDQHEPKMFEYCL